MMIYRFFIGWFFSAALYSLAWAQQALPSQPPEFDVNRITQSVVAVRAITDKDANSVQTLGQLRQGSGVVIDRDLILTIGYLLIEAEKVDIADVFGRRVPGQVLAVDTVSGFGLIRTLIPLQLNPIPIGNSDAVTVSEKVFTLGHGETELTELQLVARQPFAGTWEYLLEAPLMTIPAVNNWSGAGLFSNTGQLIGLGSLLVPNVFGNQQRISGNLFVPINELKPHLNSLVTSGKRMGSIQSWLGITSQSIAGGGLILLRVASESPAAQAGLKAGDILTTLESRPLTNLQDFYRQLWTVGPAGSVINLIIKRDGQEIQVQLVTGDRAMFMKAPRGI